MKWRTCSSHSDSDKHRIRNGLPISRPEICLNSITASQQETRSALWEESKKTGGALCGGSGLTLDLGNFRDTTKLKSVIWGTHFAVPHNIRSHNEEPASTFHSLYKGCLPALSWNGHKLNHHDVCINADELIISPRLQKHKMTNYMTFITKDNAIWHSGLHDVKWSHHRKFAKDLNT